ncbi:MAG: hypothetical protein WAO13_10435, partial [Pseudolabrys sp.]
MRHIHLVGSVPLADAHEVFATVSEALGPYLKRIPDGETGDRSDWITWLEPVFANNPALEKSDELFRIHATGTARVRYRLRPGKSVRDVTFDNLFYADVAKQSYAEFAALKQAGKIAPNVRFQIDLVPAHSVIWLFLQDDLHKPLDPVFKEALKREIDKIAAAGVLVAETIAHVGSLLRPGITTDELDAAAGDFIREHGGIPTSEGYKGYPKAICISP